MSKKNRTVRFSICYRHSAISRFGVDALVTVFRPVTAGIMKVLSKRPINAVRELRTLCCVYTVSRDRASRSTPLSLAVNLTEHNHYITRVASLLGQ